MIQNLSKIANTVKPETGLFPVVKGEKGLGVDTALHVMHSLHLRWLQWLIVMSTIGHTHTLIFSSANFDSRKEDFLAKSLLEWNGKASQELWIVSLMSLFIERWQIMLRLLFSSVRKLMSRCWIFFMLSQCLYVCHNLCICIYAGLVMSHHHPDQMYQRSQVFRIALCSQNVFFLVINIRKCISF